VTRIVTSGAREIHGHVWLVVSASNDDDDRSSFDKLRMSERAGVQKGTVTGTRDTAR
jgi:hypothetical protein